MKDSTSFYDKRTNSEFVKLLVRWFVIDMLPFSLVESTYFNDFIQKLNPKFKCPGRSTLKKEIVSEFKSRRDNIVDFVKNIQAVVHLQLISGQVLKMKHLLE